MNDDNVIQFPTPHDHSKDERPCLNCMCVEQANEMSDEGINDTIHQLSRFRHMAEGTKPDGKKMPEFIGLIAWIMKAFEEYNIIDDDIPEGDIFDHAWELARCAMEQSLFARVEYWHNEAHGDHE